MEGIGFEKRWKERDFRKDGRNGILGMEKDAGKWDFMEKKMEERGFYR